MSCVQVVDMLKPAPQNADDWTELKGNSSSWAPPNLSERQSLPAHSMAAFDVVYELRELVGEGGFGSVHMGVRKKTGALVAIKIIKTGNGCKERDLEDEATLMRQLNHPHVIKTIDAYWTVSPRDELRLVEEYASGGELFSWCRKRRRELVDSDHKRLAAELLRGLAYLHSHGIIHRDIKPKNLLMYSCDDNAPLRIADFGLCKRYKASNQPPVPAKETGGRSPRGSASGPSEEPKATPRRRPRRITRSFVGTTHWMAPEVLVCASEDARGYSFPADVWAAGCVIYSLVSGKLDDNGPFTPEEGDDKGGSMEAVFRAILERQLTYQHVENPAARDLLQSLLATVPRDRASAMTALEHSWLSLLPALPAGGSTFGRRGSDGSSSASVAMSRPTTASPMNLATALTPQPPSSPRASPFPASPRVSPQMPRPPSINPSPELPRFVTRMTGGPGPQRTPRPEPRTPRPEPKPPEPNQNWKLQNRRGARNHNAEAAGSDSLMQPAALSPRRNFFFSAAVNGFGDSGSPRRQ